MPYVNVLHECQAKLLLYLQYGYRMGKVALHIAGVTLARDFKEIGIPVGLIHPGVVRHQSHCCLSSLNYQLVVLQAGFLHLSQSLA